MWELEGEDYSIVPGYKYVSDKGDEVKKETQMDIDMAMVAEQGAPLSAQEKQDLCADGREWRVKPKRKSRRPRIMAEEKPTLRTVQGPPSKFPLDSVSSPDGHVLKEMDVVTTRLHQRLGLGSWNLFDAIAGIEMNALIEPEVDDTPSPLPSPTLEQDKFIEPPPEEASETLTVPAPLRLRSALKGTRPPPNLTTRRRTSFAETATILSHHTHPSTPACPSPIKEPHNTYTVAERARRSSFFYRPSPIYRPSTWASHEGFEKADTSYQKVPWPVRERMLERGDDDGEMRDRDEEKPNSIEKWNSQVTDTMDDVRKHDNEGGMEKVKWIAGLGDAMVELRDAQKDEPTQQEDKSTQSDYQSSTELGKEWAMVEFISPTSTPTTQTPTSSSLSTSTSTDTSKDEDTDTDTDTMRDFFPLIIDIDACPFFTFIRGARRISTWPSPPRPHTPEIVEMVPPKSLIAGRWRHGWSNQSENRELILHPSVRAGRRKPRVSSSKEVVLHRTARNDAVKAVKRRRIASWKEVVLHPTVREVVVPETVAPKLKPNPFTWLSVIKEDEPEPVIPPGGYRVSAGVIFGVAERESER